VPAFVSLSCGVFAPGDGKEELHWEVLTVVDFSGDPKVLRALRTLRGALEHVDFRGQERSYGGRGGLQRHMERLPALPNLIVLVLGDFSSDVDIEVREVIRVLEALTALWLIAVVSENPSQWSDLPRVHGFIKAAQGQLGVDATQVTLQLASVFAPETLICVDLADWCEALGTAHAPSTLSRAFIQEGDKRSSLGFRSRLERRAVETASALAVMPLYTCTRLRQTRDLMEAVAEIVQDDSTVILSAPFKFIREHAALSGGSAGVLLLCRPATV
jgi:hypothetical protein